MFWNSKKTEKIIEQEIEQEQKEQAENRLKWQNYLIAVLLVLAGIVFICTPEIEISFICKFLAGVLAVAGLVSIAMYCIRDIATGYYRLDLVYGALALFAALIFITKQEVIGEYFPVIVGFVLFANGVVKLQHSIDMKRIDRKMKKVTEMWLVVMIFALVCIAAGSTAVYLKTSENRTMFLFLGISLTVAGITDVLTHIAFSRKIKLFKSGDYLEAKDDTADDKEKAAEEKDADTVQPVEDDMAAYMTESEPMEGHAAWETPVTETVPEENTEDAADTES